MKNSRKWSSAEVATHIKKIQGIVKKEKSASKLEHFSAVSEDELEQKFMRVNSPMIVFQSWNSTTQGGIVTYNVGIYNPDPTSVGSLYLQIWVGSGNVVGNIGSFLANVDTRFPRLTEPNFAGLTLAPGASTTVTFNLNIPVSVEETKYLGNCCLMQVRYHDVGTYLDRGCFPIQVS
tara:strand:+ start:2368 stop:2898 length:531 start_codon:yes stop_codon:yes gene_type:complete